MLVDQLGELAADCRRDDHHHLTAFGADCLGCLGDLAQQLLSKRIVEHKAVLTALAHHGDEHMLKIRIQSHYRQRLVQRRDLLDQQRRKAGTQCLCRIDRAEVSGYQ